MHNLLTGVLYIAFKSYFTLSNILFNTMANIAVGDGIME